MRALKIYSLNFHTIYSSVNYIYHEFLKVVSDFLQVAIHSIRTAYVYYAINIPSSPPDTSRNVCVLSPVASNAIFCVKIS